jgi:hypothetical protein
LHPDRGSQLNAWVLELFVFNVATAMEGRQESDWSGIAGGSVHVGCEFWVLMGKLNV